MITHTEQGIYVYGRFFGNYSIPIYITIEHDMCYVKLKYSGDIIMHGRLRDFMEVTLNDKL